MKKDKLTKVQQRETGSDYFKCFQRKIIDWCIVSLVNYAEVKKIFETKYFNQTISLIF